MSSSATVTVSLGSSLDGALEWNDETDGPSSSFAEYEI